MSTQHPWTAPPSDSKAVGITLAPGPGRAAALSIVGVPLAIFLLIGYITAPGGGSPNASGPGGAGLYSTGTQTTPAFTDTGQAAPPEAPLSTATQGLTPSVSGLTPVPTTSPVAPATVTPFAPATVTPTVGDTPGPSVTATATGPAATVLAAYAAINQQDYQTAYSLGLGDPQPGESLQEYSAGYANTVSVAVTITAVQGDTVSVSLDATQADGTHQTFSGTYTVSGGHITSASIQRTN